MHFLWRENTNIRANALGIQHIIGHSRHGSGCHFQYHSTLFLILSSPKFIQQYSSVIQDVIHSSGVHSEFKKQKYQNQTSSSIDFIQK